MASGRAGLACSLALSGCAPEGLLVGTWEITLVCEQGAAAVPACAQPPRAIVEVDDDAPIDGRHLSLLPGFPRADGAYSGVIGPVTGSWEGGAVALVLSADRDDLLMSAGDREVWTGRALWVTGAPAARCWDGRWQLAAIDDPTEVLAAGVARARDVEVDCVRWDAEPDAAP